MYLRKPLTQPLKTQSQRFEFELTLFCAQVSVDLPPGPPILTIADRRGSFASLASEDLVPGSPMTAGKILQNPNSLAMGELRQAASAVTGAPAPLPERTNMRSLARDVIRALDRAVPITVRAHLEEDLGPIAGIRLDDVRPFHYVFRAQDSTPTVGTLAAL